MPVWNALPSALQVSMTLPLQRFSPGVQPPVHNPLEQPYEQLRTNSHAVPLGLHSSTTLPLQRCSTGLQVVGTVQAPELHPSGQLCTVTQVPLESHSWTLLLLH